MFGWNNTGSQRKKIAPTVGAGCPRCGHVDETQEHVFQCSAGVARKERYNAMVKMRL